MNNYDDLLKNFYNIITFDLFIKLLVVYFFIIWISIIVWVLKDITNRTNSLLLQLLSLFIVVFLTPFWVFLYLLIRPGRTNLEKMYREIDDNLDLLSTIMKDKYWNCEVTICPKCNYKLSSDFKYCPECSTKLKTNCKSCKKEISLNWKTCPYCSEKVKDKEDDKDKKHTPKKD